MGDAAGLQIVGETVAWRALVAGVVEVVGAVRDVGEALLLAAAQVVALGALGAEVLELLDAVEHDRVAGLAVVRRDESVPTRVGGCANWCNWC